VRLRCGWVELRDWWIGKGRLLCSGGKAKGGELIAGCGCVGWAAVGAASGAQWMDDASASVLLECVRCCWVGEWRLLLLLLECLADRWSRGGVFFPFGSAALAFGPLFPADAALRQIRRRSANQQ